MPGPPTVQSVNVAVVAPEPQPVLAPAGNKDRTNHGLKPASKPVKKSVSETDCKEKKQVPNSNRRCVSVPAILKRQDHPQAVPNMSVEASCSSDASSTNSSTHSGASTSGKMVGRINMPLRKK